MAINFLKLKHLCFLSIQQLCSLAYQVIYGMTLVWFLFRTCLRPARVLALLLHFFNKNFYATNVDKWSYPQNSVSLGYSSTGHECCPLNMSDGDGSATMQSQIWKRVVSFKRKLLGGSSVLPSSILEVVTRKSQTVLSQQSNSVQMPDYCGSGSKRPKLELIHNTMTPDNTVVVIPEDLEPSMSSESLDPASLLFGDELVGLFDSDSQKETRASVTTSCGKSEFL